MSPVTLRSLAVPARVPSAGPTIAALAEEMIGYGVRRVHVLAWRDLDDPDAGGSEVHADEFMRRWAAAGLEVLHRTSHAIGLPDVDRRNGYDVVRRGSRYSVFGRAVTAELARRMGPYDALVEIWNGVPWFSPVWCRRPHVTMLHHVHGPMWDQILPPPLAGAGRLLEARIAPPFYRRTQTVTPSAATRAELLGLGFAPERVTAVDNGIDPFFHPAGRRAEHPVIVAVARLAPVKRTSLVVAAMERVHERVPDAELVIIGDGPLRGDLEAQARSGSAAGRITFTGHLGREALREQYRRAWLVTSASLAEGWGLTMTEAAACGVPAVASDISGHRCSIVNGTTGVLVEPQHLGDAIADLLLDHDRRLRMSEAGLARAATLTWEASATGLLEVLAGVVRSRARHRLHGPRR